MSQIEQRVEINQDTLDQMRAYTPEQRRAEALRCATAVGCAGTISYDGPARAFILSTAARFERYLESGIAVDRAEVT
jgi:hypothetical protein